MTQPTVQASVVGAAASSRQRSAYAWAAGSTPAVWRKIRSAPERFPAQQAASPRAKTARASGLNASELPAHFASPNKIGECAEVFPSVLDAASYKRRVNAMGTGIVHNFSRR